MCTGLPQEIEKGIKSFKVSKASPIAELHTWQNTSQREQKQPLLLEATSPCVANHASCSSPQLI
jgi:hypothetical protein